MGGGATSRTDSILGSSGGVGGVSSLALLSSTRAGFSTFTGGDETDVGEIAPWNFSGDDLGLFLGEEERIFLRGWLGSSIVKSVFGYLFKYTNESAVFCE